MALSDSTVYYDGVTHIKAAWANDADALVYDIFAGSTTKSSARAAIGLGSVATQAASNIALTGGMIDNVNIGSLTPANGRFSNCLIEGTPVNLKHAVPKWYVDNIVSTIIGISGALTLHVANTSVHLTPSQNLFLDGLTISASDANSLSGITGNVQIQLNNKLDKTDGGIVNNDVGIVGTLDMNGGPIINVLAPVNPNDAANKAYVDGAASSLGGGYGAPVQNLPDLQSLPSGTLTDKQIRLVEDEGSIFYYNLQSVAVVDGVNVVAPVDLIGRWHRSVPGAGPHNSMTSIQGGGPGNYWHFTSAEHTYLSTLAATTSVSSLEYSYLDGVTSPIQTQLNNKVNRTGDTMSGSLTIVQNTPASVGLSLAPTTNGVDATIAINTNNGLRRLSFQNNGSEVGALSQNLSNNITLSSGSSIALSPTNRVIVGPLASDDTSTFFQVYGETKISGLLNLTSNRIINVDTPINNNDAVNKAYVDGLLIVGSYLPLVGGTMAGVIDMAGYRISNVANATTGADAVSRDYGDSRYLQLSGGTLTGNVTSQDVSGIAYRARNTVFGNQVEISLDANGANRFITFRESGTLLANIHVDTNSAMLFVANGAIALDSAVNRVIVGAIGFDDSVNQLQVDGAVRVAGIIHGVSTPVVGTDAANKAYVDGLAGFALEAPDSLLTSPQYTFASDTAIGMSFISNTLSIVGGSTLTNILGKDGTTSGGSILVRGGVASSSGTAGNVSIISGEGQGTANSGNLSLVASNATGTGNGGYFEVQAGGSQRLAILPDGDWLLNGSPGASGYTPVSNGPGSPVTWQLANTLTVLSGTAFEDLLAGELVAVFSNVGVCAVRKAFAGVVNQYASVGYVLADALTGASVSVVMTESKIDVSVTLNPGDTYYLSNTVPGSITNAAPSNPGEMIQTVGVAEDTNTLVVTMSRDPIML